MTGGADGTERSAGRDRRWHRCDACDRAVAVDGWFSRPGGWFILFPPGGSLLADPLEVKFCSERCAIAWLQDRVRARMTAMQEMD